jgi:hypothetical protein
MARKVGKLEGAILELYRRLDAATPAIHKQTTGKGGSSATESPWVKLYRAGCELVVAAVEVGDHCRQAAGIEKPGPIQESLSDDAFQRIRAWSGGRAGSGAAGDPEGLRQAAREVEGRLPAHAHISDEMQWVAANLHDPQPAFDKAPSRTAVSLLLDAKRDERVRREFWIILLSKRLSPGEPRRKATAFAEDSGAEPESAESEAERMDRLLGRLRS